MKKLLTSLSLIATAIICTACGDNMKDSSDSGSYYEEHDYGNGNYDATDRHETTSDRNSDNLHDDFSNIGDDVKDAVDDVEDAGEEIITDVGSGISDIFDGDNTDTDIYTDTDTTTTVVTTTE